MIKNIDTFRFWCQKVLPLVYDDSLSYYELLCKVVHYIDDLIDNDKIIGSELEDIRNEIEEIKAKIDTHDTDLIEKIIEESLLKMIIVGINDSGYFVYSIPDSWTDITFNTTGVDTEIEGYEYGRLVLSY